MAKTALTIIVSAAVVFAVCRITAEEKAERTPDNMLALLTKEVSYKDILKCLDLCTAEPSLLENFHGVYLFPSKGINAIKNVAEYPLTINIDIAVDEKKNRRLEGVHVTRQCGREHVGTVIGYSDPKGGIYFDEIGEIDNVTVILHPNKNLKSVLVNTDESRRKVLFDEQGNTISDQSDNRSIDSKKRFQKELKKMAETIRTAERHADVPLDKKIDATLKIPSKLAERNVLTHLKQVESYLQAVKKGSVSDLTASKVFDIPNQRIYVVIREYLGVIRFVSISRHEMWVDMDTGFFLEFDEQGRIVRYTEGNIKFDFNESGKTVAQTAIIPKDGSAVEILFHSSGYPASYKTLVRNRLFGRQMEWNEKGDVLSDVDLDIPTELPEIQKALDEEKAKK